LEKAFRAGARIYALLKDIDAVWASEQVDILIAIKTK